MGVANVAAPLAELPGWYEGGWGYHSDDGDIHDRHDEGRSYAEKFTTNDTIGCGVNLKEHTAYFTKNGKHLGVQYARLLFRRLLTSRL